MEVDIDATAPEQRTTEVQFSMRAMLIVTGVVAVVATALGIFIRTFPEDTRLNLVIFWSILAAIFVVMFAFHARRRFVAEKEAGGIRFQLTRHNYFFPNAPVFATYLVGVLLLSAAPGMWVGGSFAIAGKASVGTMINYGTIVSVISSGYGIAHLWWRRIQLCEHGMINHNELSLWQDCQRWYWDACNKNVVVIISSKGRPVAAKVPADERAAVESLLNEKVKLYKKSAVLREK